MLLRFTNGYTQLKEVAKGVAVNVSVYAVWELGFRPPGRRC